MIVWTTLTWVLTPILMYFYGFNGVAISSFIISFSSVLSIYYVKKVVPIDAWGQIWQPLLAAVVMAIVSASLIPVWSLSFRHLFVGMLIAAIAYFGTLLLVGKKKLNAEISSILAYSRHTQ
jgi:uncharacterized membrane protein YjjB (DUF3815 family)